MRRPTKLEELRWLIKTQLDITLKSGERPYTKVFSGAAIMRTDMYYLT